MLFYILFSLYNLYCESIVNIFYIAIYNATRFELISITQNNLRQLSWRKLKKFSFQKNLYLLLLYIAFILNLSHLKIRGRDGLIIYLKIDGICTYNM